MIDPTPARSGGRRCITPIMPRDPRPTNCSNCGRPIRGAWNWYTKRYATRCQVCSRGQTGDRVQAAYKLLTKYGMTLAEYEAMVEAQGGVCAACARAPSGSASSGGTRLNVDHCHESGAIRGLLCRDCNNALGHVRDDPATLRALADYLEAQPEPEQWQLRLVEVA